MKEYDKAFGSPAHHLVVENLTKAGVVSAALLLVRGRHSVGSLPWGCTKGRHVAVYDGDSVPVGG